MPDCVLEHSCHPLLLGICRVVGHHGMSPSVSTCPIPCTPCRALDEDASSNSVTSWYADVEQTLAKLDVLQTGYQVMAKKGP